MNHYQKQVINELTQTPEKIAYVKSKTKKHVEDFDKCPDCLDTFVKDTIKKIREKQGIPISDDIKVKIEMKDDKHFILSTNITDSLFCFTNEGDHGLFFILNKMGQITYAKVFIGDNFKFNLKDVKVKRKRHTGPRKRRKDSFLWAIEEFLKEYFPDKISNKE